VGCAVGPALALTKLQETVSYQLLSHLIVCKKKSVGH